MAYNVRAKVRGYTAGVALAAAALGNRARELVDPDGAAMRVAKEVRRFLEAHQSSRIPRDVRRAFRMPHQGYQEAERRVRQGKAGTGGPWHARNKVPPGDVRCGCRECIEWRRVGLDQ